MTTAGTILVVEDHPSTRKLVRVALAAEGYRVLEAESGAQALAYAAAQPDLVLLDLHLPDMQGFEVAERLRAAGLGADRPILAFSGFLPALEDGRIAAAGLAGFITKPVEPSRLLEIVRLHLSEPTAPALPGRGVRVLVVEDDAIQRKLLVAKLARLGFTVCEADDGEAALELLRTVRVDAVVSDVLMPRRDGFELAHAIRTTPALAHLPVVLVTAHVQESDDHRLAEAVGAHALLLRQPGFAGIAAVIVDSVRAGPRPCAPTAVEELRAGFLHRVIRQLERQGAFNAHLTQQSSMQAAQLDILAGTAELLTRTLDADVLLEETLGRTLETLRFTKGAAYLLEGDRLVLRAQRGFDAGTAAGLEDLFGHVALLHEVATAREPVFVSAADPRGAAVLAAAPEAWADQRSFLVTPFLSGADVLGVCVIGCARLEVGQEWRPFALAIGSQVGQALAVMRAMGQLRASEQRAQSILEALSIGVVLVGPDERIQSHNASAARLLGGGGQELAGRSLRELAGWLRREDGRPVRYDQLTGVRAVRTGRPHTMICSVEPPRVERRRWLSVGAEPLMRAGEARPGGAVVSYADITERRQLEQMLRQSQKLEAVGRLAGGIAHDFNNLLMVISSFSELARAGVPEGSELASDLEEIQRAAERATALTRQLLTFSRAKDVALRVLDVNALVRDAEKMLRRLMPAAIRFIERLAAEPLQVRADAGQLEQVLVNLVVNAGDAMPDGGSLTLTTAHVELDADAAAVAGVAAGAWVELCVRDTGIGMSEAVRERLFEPFFTTKPPGKGTGLGLATVYGIVQQFGGAVLVESTPGQGTLFRVLLPAVSELDMSITGEMPVPAPPLAARTILVVDDERPLRHAIATWLRQRDHTVLEAGTGEEALAVAARHAGPIDLLLSDVTMPGLGGVELARRLRQQRPEVRILLMSGHAERAHAGGVLAPAADCLAKPFTLEALGRRLHEVLALPAPSPGGEDRRAG